MLATVDVHIGAEVWVIDELQRPGLPIDSDGVGREWQAVAAT